MDAFVLSAFIVGTIVQIVAANDCDEQLNHIYSPEHANVTFQFTVSPDSERTYGFKYHIGNTTARDLLIVYSDNTVSTLPFITYIGDVSTGNISLVYRNVTRSEAGVYSLQNILGPDMLIQCVSLYILGIPDIPTVVVDRIPDEGEDVMLTCSGSRSTTIPDDHNLTLVFSWTVDDVNNPVNPRYNYTADKDQFTITNVSLTDTEKQITCQATEDVFGGFSSSNSSEISVKIYYGPKNIQFVPENITYELDELSQFGPVDCTASCFPACTYRWDTGDDEEQASNNGTLYIDKLTSNDTGTYTCNATNPERVGKPQYTGTKQMNISVIYGPKHISLSPSTTLYHHLEGYKMPSIECASECYTCQYTWTGPTINSAGGQLDLGVLTRYLHGRYNCTVMNNKTEATLTTDFIVEVVYGPDSAYISEEHALNVTEGTTHADITCSSDCYPSCYSSWISITGGSVDISGDILSLGKVTRNQTGKYKCTTSNTDPGYQRAADTTLDIAVHYVPEINVVVSPNTKLIEHSYAKLRCNASGVPSNYNYVALTQTWGNTTIPNLRPPITTTPIHSSFRFDALRLEDTGTYTCVVNNGVRDDEGILNQTSSIEILVQVSPKILLQELTFTGELSGFVRINVPFYSFPPADSITITRQDGVRIQNNNRTNASHEISPVMTKFYGKEITLNGSIAYIQITDILETDYTNYILEVTNSIGRDLKVINLIPYSESTTQTSTNIVLIIGGAVGSAFILAVGVVVAKLCFRRRNIHIQANSPKGFFQTPQEVQYITMDNLTLNVNEYLEMDREQDQLQTDNTNVYVNLELLPLNKNV